MGTYLAQTGRVKFQLAVTSRTTGNPHSGKRYKHPQIFFLYTERGSLNS